jgi:hypothetical protein
MSMAFGGATGGHGARFRRSWGVIGNPLACTCGAELIGPAEHQPDREEGSAS